MSLSPQAKQAFVKILDPLIGGIITKIVISESEDAYLPYHGFIVEKDGKEFQVVAQRDPEGNGSGFMEIMSMDKPPKSN